MARRVTRRGVCATVGSLVAGCTGLPGQQSPSPTENPVSGEVTRTGDLTLASPAFEANETIPEKYGKAYQNVNPPLTIDGVPESATSLALVVDDPDAPGGTFTPGRMPLPTRRIQQMAGERKVFLTAQSMGTDHLSR